MITQKLACSPLSRFVVFGMQTFFLCMLHSIFRAFFVDFFLRSKLFAQTSKEKSSERSITDIKSAALWHIIIGQAGYMIWCTLTDVGLRCLRDAQLKAASLLRLSQLSVCGPLWTLIFALLWVPLRVPYVYPGLIYMVLMITYDTLFVYCSEACKTTFYGNRRRSVEREKCSTTALVFRVLSSTGVGLASCLYGGTNTTRWRGVFRAYNGIWALIAGSCFYMSSRPQEVMDLSSDLDIVEDYNEDVSQSSNKFFTFAFRTLRRNSMKAVTILYALQGYSSALSTNLFPLFLMVVCANKPSSLLSSLLLTLFFVVPHALSAPITHLYTTYGKKNTVTMILLLRWGLGFLLLVLSAQMTRNAGKSSEVNPDNQNLEKKQGGEGPTIRGYGIVFALLFFAHGVLTEATMQLQTVVLVDVTDEDTVIFGRGKPMSAALHRLTLFPSKIFHSLAIISTCVSLYSFDAIPLDVPHMVESNKKDLMIAAKVVRFVAINAMLVSMLILIVWVKLYDLSGKYLAFVQMAMRKRAEREMVGDI